MIQKLNKLNQGGQEYRLGDVILEDLKHYEHKISVTDDINKISYHKKNDTFLVSDGTTYDDKLNLEGIYSDEKYYPILQLKYTDLKYEKKITPIEDESLIDKSNTFILSYDRSEQLIPTLNIGTSTSSNGFVLVDDLVLSKTYKLLFMNGGTGTKYFYFSLNNYELANVTIYFENCKSTSTYYYVNYSEYNPSYVSYNSGYVYANTALELKIFNFKMTDINRQPTIRGSIYYNDNSNAAIFIKIDITPKYDKHYYYDTIFNKGVKYESNDIKFLDTHNAYTPKYFLILDDNSISKVVKDGTEYRLGATNITNDSVVLTSPNGTQYKITVDNNGNLTTTAV